MTTEEAQAVQRQVKIIAEKTAEFYGHEGLRLDREARAAWEEAHKDEPERFTSERYTFRP